MPTSPSLQDEASFISGVAQNGTLDQNSYWGWGNNTPATYTSGWVLARKWGATTAGTGGGTVTYYFDPGSNWSTGEQNQFTASLALWSAVANISFVQTTDSSKAQIWIERGQDGSAWTGASFHFTSGAAQAGGSTLLQLTGATVSIDTSVAGFGQLGNFGYYGGYSVETVLHELGHALGLGHAGPYNGNVNPGTQQYSAYDSRQWSIMSYIQPEATGAKYYSQDPAKANYNGRVPTTWMPADILAIQSLYGVATNTPLSGGQTFGFNCNVTGPIEQYFDFTKNKMPIITIWDKGTDNTLNVSGFAAASTIDLNPGTFSSTCGLTNNIAIAYGTAVDNLVCGSGDTTVTLNNNGDTVTGGAGNDTFIVGAGNDVLNGGGGTDTAKFAGDYSAYDVTCGTDGTITVKGGSGTDLLSSVETLVFADQTVAASSLSSTSTATSSTSPPPPPPAPPPSPTPAPTPAPEPTGVGTVPVAATSDLDGNGKSDILRVNQGASRITIWQMKGTENYAANTLNGPKGWSIVGIADFSQDGYADVLWQSRTTGQLKLWEMKGGYHIATTEVASDPGAGWQMQTVGDFNGDNKPDLVLQKGAQIQIWTMNWYKKLSSSTATAPSGFHIVGAGDFNGDGTQDLLWQDASTGQMEIWTMKDGAPVSEDVLSSNPGATWRAAGVGDFNADGKSDILLQNSDGQTAIWFMDGTTKLAGSGDAGKNLGTAWKALGTGDYNGDGYSDILLQNQNNGQVYVEMMTGTTALSSSGTVPAYSATYWSAMTG